MAAKDAMLLGILLPSAPVLVHVFGVMPILIASSVGLIGFGQFLLGMRENRIVGFLVILMLLPFMFPSVFAGLVKET